ncbi:MAG: NADPH-dependent FMN reductase [Opitutaceae bacterium]|jgi:NAD(P)H-dependent FMN reductase
MKHRQRILTLCGSLRSQSSNREILRAYEQLAPVPLTFEHYERLGTLPHFNPDLDGDDTWLPTEVLALRTLVSGADAVVISTPEYAHALPGSFKNALDWLVGDPAFANKPVVILHAARGSSWAFDSLTEVLRTMSARVIKDACVMLPLGSNQADKDAILTRENFRALLLGSMTILLTTLTRHQTATDGNGPS